MTFEEWWKKYEGLGGRPTPMEYAAAEMAWNAAVEASAKVADDYSAGYEAVRAAEGQSWCPQCKEYTQDVADQIGRAIREGKS